MNIFNFTIFLYISSTFYPYQISLGVIPPLNLHKKISLTLIFTLSICLLFSVTITSGDNQNGTTFDGFLIEVFTNLSDTIRFSGGEFTVPSNAHQTCSGVSRTWLYFEDSYIISCLDIYRNMFSPLFAGRNAF